MLYCFGKASRPNIGLTFKAWPERRCVATMRGIGVVFASSSRKNHDKRLYKVEAFVMRIFLTLFLYAFYRAENHYPM